MNKFQNIKKIKCGVIGCGRLGRFHAEIFKNYRYSDLSAVCDNDYGKAEEMGKLFKVNFYTDYNKMLENEEIDAVGIATPDFAHTEPIIACANKKKHILCEKPLVTKEDDLERVVKSINKEKIRIMVNYSNRWNVPFNIIKEKISSGILGKPINAYMRLNNTIYVPEEYITWANKTSILWFLGSHSVDIITWILNDKVEKVYSVCHKGVLKSKGINCADTFLTILNFKNGTIVQLENGWVTPNTNTSINDIKFNLLCTKGMINIDGSSSSYFQVFSEQKIENPDFSIRPKLYGIYFGYAAESIRSFIRSISLEEDFVIDFKESINVNKILFSILESSKKGCSIDINY